MRTPWISGGSWRTLELHGAKEIVHDRPKDLWPDTTALPVQVRQATGEQLLVLSGKLHLTLPRVLRAVVGMRATGTVRVAVKTIIDFDRFFVANLASVYLAAVRPGRPVTPRRLRGNGSRTASAV